MERTGKTLRRHWPQLPNVAAPGPRVLSVPASESEDGAYRCSPPIDRLRTSPDEHRLHPFHWDQSRPPRVDRRGLQFRRAPTANPKFRDRSNGRQSSSPPRRNTSPEPVQAQALCKEDLLLV